MTTDPAQFQRLIELIPPEIMDDVWFFPLPSGKKFPPEVPKGTVMNFNEEYRLTPSQALDRMKAGKNVLIYARPQGLLFIDADTKKGKIVLPEETLNNFPSTLKIKSRNGGYHYYFLNTGLFKNKIHKYNGEKSGEIKADWQYVVAPGSFVVNDDDGREGANGLYSIINDAPILTLERIPDGLTISEDKVKEEIKIEIETRQTWKNDTGMPLYEIRKKSQKLDLLLKGANENDRSAADMAAVQLLYFWKFTDTEIAGILQEYRPYEKTARQDYLETTISKIDRSARYNPNYKGNGNGNGSGKDGSEEPQYEELDLEAINQRQIKENNRKLEVNLPEDHFVSLYVKWQSGLSDAYPDYHIVDALWLLSAMTRGKVVLELKQERVKPNIWNFNIGKSTTSRKSTAVNQARRIYETATDIDLPNDDYSIEGYLESLSLSPITNNVRDEAAGLLAKFHKKYNDGIFDLECQLYDGQNVKKTLASAGKKEPKTFTIKKPYVTKLYATTGDNFARYMEITDFTCGYGFRFLYTYPRYKKPRKPLMLSDDDDINARAEILTRVKKTDNYFKNLTETIKFKATAEAMQYHDNVCMEMEKAADEQDNDILNSVIGRSEVHILKIAMLLELGKNQMSNTITLETMTEAAQMVRSYFVPCIMDLIDQLQEDIKINKIEKIRSVIRRLGGKAAHVTVLRNCNMTAREFEECIFTMQESKAIDIVKEKNSKAKYYILINHNKGFDVSKGSKVSNGSKVVRDNNTPTNFTNLATDDMKIIDVPDQSESVKLTYEQNELYEPYEPGFSPELKTADDRQKEPTKEEKPKIIKILSIRDLALEATEHIKNWGKPSMLCEAKETLIAHLKKADRSNHSLADYTKICEGAFVTRNWMIA